ncbi:LysE family transporter [Aquimarina sp. 2201CG5-10]|uniref:LysE family transporter n=1 Tax=Aquimarina callyspongiae TaxID=3098150 RepID=UPI002AB335B4|nr:LysE family transporter [Aquimarina sp. 2201CG5-10]MDY8136652.1 LysE family transporter [Aquimarina sp. 2201CG5-10]
MIALYLILGIFSAILGALPLGAVNIAVINTTIKESTKKALYIAIAAGVGEVFLALFALHCSMELSHFFDNNQWIQVVFIVIFLLIGVYFLVIKKQTTKEKKPPKINLGKSKFLTGFSLAFLNPPVIIYWIIAISLTNEHLFKLTTQTPLTALFLFFSGIYFGKIATLYLYSKWGNKMVQKQGDSKAKLSKIMGIALIVISIFQGIKFLAE